MYSFDGTQTGVFVSAQWIREVQTSGFFVVYLTEGVETGSITSAHCFRDEQIANVAVVDFSRGCRDKRYCQRALDLGGADGDIFVDGWLERLRRTLSQGGPTLSSATPKKDLLWGRDALRGHRSSCTTCKYDLLWGWDAVCELLSPAYSMNA